MVLPQRKRNLLDFSAVLMHLMMNAGLAVTYTQHSEMGTFLVFARNPTMSCGAVKTRWGA